ncbi:hypothetical protein VTL71DRAFT_12353 [Oculimacula yallundae]|uniref:Uncharacterized protein n=1 Tax=Oculimacula yallundae TaxID=86028 RepID=A0ABR4CMC0_9HELO
MAPGLKRQYRPDVSDADQQSGNVSIEQYLAGKDPYRVAPPGEIPIPWPFRACPFPNNREEIEPAIQDECCNICAEYNITTRPADINTYRRKGSLTPVTCLVIETRDIDTTHWQAAAAKLRNLVQEDRFRLPNGDVLKVEIRNGARMYADYSTCLPSDENLKRYLEEIEPKLIGLAKETLYSKCTSIAYHMRGSLDTYRFDSSIPCDYLTPPRPTVIIYVKPGTTCVFEEVETKFQKVMDSPNFPDMAMDLEILPGIISNAANGHCEPVCLARNEGIEPSNNMSIGASDLSKQTGSLGGWIRLTSKSDPSQITDCVMTAYHIFKDADAENGKVTDVNGIGFSDSDGVPGIEVVWPSNGDEAFTRYVCEKWLAPGLPRSNNEEALHSCLSLLDKIQGSGRSIGKVSYTSGHAKRSPSNARLDWVLIPSPHTTQLNKPPGWLNIRPGQPEPYYRMDEDSHVRNIEPDLIRKSNWTIRSGRTSANQGYINARHRVVFWEDAHKHKESFEMDIVPVGRCGDVCDTGDEGSWLVNANLELVGMLIGKCEGDSQNGGIATPIHHLIADIAKRTNSPQSLTIEQHIANKEPSRVSPPNTSPIPWPFTKQARSFELFTIETDIQGPCHEICSRHSITIRSATIEALRHKFLLKSDSWEPIPTLVIETGNLVTTTWRAAASELQELVERNSWFRLSNGGGLKVKIRNPVMMYDYRITQFPRGEDLDAYINKVEPRMMRVIEERLHEGSLAFYGHRHVVEGVNPMVPGTPTALIHVRPNSERDWAEVEMRLLEAMAETEYEDVVVDLEIMPGVGTDC